MVGKEVDRLVNSTQSYRLGRGLDPRDQLLGPRAVRMICRLPRFSDLLRDTSGSRAESKSSYDL